MNPHSIDPPLRGSDACGPLVTIRPLTRADTGAIEAVFAGLSPRSRFLRYHCPTPRLTGTLRRWLLDVEGPDHAGLLAEARTRSGRRPIGMAHVVRAGSRTAELAIEVVDSWQQRGVGTLLFDAAVTAAAERGFTELLVRIHPDNHRVLRSVDRAFPGTPRLRDDDAIVVQRPVSELVPEARRAS